MSRRASKFIILVGAGVAYLFMGYLALKSKPPLVDERAHFPQVKDCILGPCSWHYGIRTLPGYHLTLTWLAQLAGASDLAYVRLCSLLFGVLAVGAFYVCASTALPRVAEARTLSFLFLPILSPYFFLIYTDPFSILLVLLGAGAYFKKHFPLSGLILGASILVRQTNIMWVGLFFCMAYVNEHGYRLSWNFVRDHLKTHFISVLVTVAFVIFVVANGGVAVGDRGAHPMSLNVENIFFSLLVFILLFAPFLLAKRSRIAEFIRQNGVRAGMILVATGLAYFDFFEADHPYNRIEGFLRNDMLSFIGANAVSELVFTGIAALSVFALCSFEFEKKEQYLLYPFWALSLLLMSLVEPRYYIPVFVLFLLFKRPERPAVEWSLTAYWAVLSLSAVLWIGPGRFL